MMTQKLQILGILKLSIVMFEKVERRKVVVGSKDMLDHIQDFIKTLIETIEKEVPDDDWIRVEDRTPKEFEDIFFYDKYKKRSYAGWYDTEGFCTAIGGVQVNITHWKPVNHPTL